MSTGRSYAGEAPEDRSARRRRQLLDAGLELFGTVGYRKTTVRALCREARVADRNFYEEFASTQDLLLAVYHECLDRLQAAATRAVDGVDGDIATLAERGLDAFFACVEDDHRLARVVWFEVLGVSSRIEAAYMQRMNDFGELLVTLLTEHGYGSGASASDRRVLLTALTGGISQVALTWVTDDFSPPRGDLVRPLTRLLRAAGQASRAPE